MAEIEAAEKVLITYKGKTEIYDGIAVAAIASLEDEEMNGAGKEGSEKIEVAKTDFFLLGSMKKETLLAMEQKFIKDTWHYRGDTDKVALIDTLRGLVAIDQRNEAEGEVESHGKKSAREL